MVNRILEMLGQDAIQCHGHYFVYSNSDAAITCFVCGWRSPGVTITCDEMLRNRIGDFKYRQRTLYGVEFMYD